MADHELAVRGLADIGLDGANAGPHRRLHRLERVVRPEPASAAVSDQLQSHLRSRSDMHE